MNTAAKLARAADKLLNRLMILLLVPVLLFGVYALWDTYLLYAQAETDLRYKPALRTDGTLDPSFAELMAQNPDVCAWLTLDDTGIDYPVVQGATNSTYINTNVYGEYSLSGSIFLDYRCAPDFTDSYSILYGHHMDGGAMFGDLLKFEDKAFFDTHTTGYLTVQDKSYRLEIYAYLHLDAYDAVFTPPSDGQAYAERLQHIENAALYYRDIGLNPSERIVLLSTCSSASTNGRGLLAARLVAYNG